MSDEQRTRLPRDRVVPEDRLFHPRLRESQKVAALSFLGRCVWEDMVLTADDFGVLPLNAALLWAGNRAFREQATLDDVGRAMEAVVSAGLFVRFSHQGQEYGADPRWQDFQKVKYPRKTHHPIPPAEYFQNFSEETKKLFQEHPEYSPNLELEMAIGKRQMANGKRQERRSGGEGAEAFERFWELYPRKVGRLAALRAWEKAVRKAEPETIVAGLERLKPSMLALASEERFLPHPATWLNGGRWSDEEPKALVAVKPGKIAGLQRFVDRGGRA